MIGPNVETPRGAIIVSKNGKAQLKWNPNFVPTYTRKFSMVQKYIDSEVLRKSSPLVPLSSGMLEKSGTLGTTIGSGEVAYIVPYARYLYHGKVMVGRAPKKLTSKDLRFRGGPTRGAKWFERMKIQHKESILKGAAEIARRTK